MFSRSRISALLVFCGLLGAPCSFSKASPAAAESTQEQTAQLQTISGRITSVQGNTFTVEPLQSQRSAGRVSPANSNKAMTFTIDQSTTVQGKIEVGANADVTYREQAGNNIAVSVRVSPPQS